MADDEKGFFGGQEIDEFLEELKRLGYLDIPKRESAAKAPRKRSTLPRIEYQTGVGKFCFPSENSWAAHRQAIKANDNALAYWPSHNPYFDNVIHQAVSYEPLWNDAKSEFPAYQVLRENLAIVRNYIMCEFFPDGSVDAEDAGKVAHLAQIARHIADGLNNDRLVPNPLYPVIRKSEANLPATGAQYIYNQIIKRQNFFSWIDPILHPIDWLRGKTPAHWGLPSLADSPFNDAALRLPPPPDPEDQLTDEDIVLIAEHVSRSNLEAPASALNFSDNLSAVAGEITAASAQYASVDQLQEPTKRELVEIAKEILKKLKLKIGEALIENGLTHFAKENFSIMDALKGAVRVYEFHLHKAMQTDPQIMENPAIKAANAAIGKLGYLAKQEVVKLAEKSGNKELAATIRKEISKMPKSWQAVSERTYGQLISTLESGLNTVLLRLSQTNRNQSSSSYKLGFMHEHTQDRPDPSHGYDDASQKAMAEHAYYQQLNAQRAAQKQGAVQSIGAMNSQVKSRDTAESAGPNATQRKPADLTQSSRASSSFVMRPGGMMPGAKEGNDKAVAAQKLVSKDQISKMRQFMATDANADVVEVSRKQAILRQEMEQRQARVQQRAATRTAQANKAAASEAATHHAEAAKDKKPDAKEVEAAKKHAPHHDTRAPEPKPEDVKNSSTKIKPPAYNPKRDPSRGI